MPKFRSLAFPLLLLSLFFFFPTGTACAERPERAVSLTGQAWFGESREPNADDLKARMESLRLAIHSQNIDLAARLTRRFYPNEQRVRVALRNDPSRAILDFYARLKPKDDAAWAKLLRTSPKRSQVSVHAATTENLIERTDIVRQEFPGGAVRMASTHFKPGVTFYEIELTEPGKSMGMKYHLFFWDGKDWCMLGPIWRAERSARRK